MLPPPCFPKGIGCSVVFTLRLNYIVGFFWHCVIEYKSVLYVFVHFTCMPLFVGIIHKIPANHIDVCGCCWDQTGLESFARLCSFMIRLRFFFFCLRIGLAAAQALGKRGAHVVVSSRRQANVDKAVALLKSQSIRVIGTTCNVGKGEDREKLVQLVSSSVFSGEICRLSAKTS